MLKILRLLSIFLFSTNALSYEYTLTFTEADIQTQIDAMLPIKKETFVVVLTLDQAKVSLLEGDNEIALNSKVFINGIAGINTQGHIALKGAVSYRSVDGAFYLSNPVITAFHVNQVPTDILPQLKELAQSGLTQALQNKPIYRLQDGDMRHQLIKSSLKSIIIQNQELKATLSL